MGTYLVKGGVRTETLRTRNLRQEDSFNGLIMFIGQRRERNPETRRVWRKHKNRTAAYCGLFLIERTKEGMHRVDVGEIAEGPFSSRDSRRPAACPIVMIRGFAVGKTKFQGNERSVKWQRQREST